MRPCRGPINRCLPELPVKVQIADFLLRELSLGAPVIGTAAQLTASGAASLGDPKEGLNLRFDASRLDAPGTLVARLNYATEKLDLNLTLDEPAGGILATSANIPGRPPVKLNVAGTGTLDAFGATLTFNAGDTIGASGQANLRREGAVRRLVLDLDAQVEGLLPARCRTRLCWNDAARRRDDLRRRWHDHHSAIIRRLKDCKARCCGQHGRQQVG